MRIVEFEWDDNNLATLVRRGSSQRTWMLCWLLVLQSSGTSGRDLGCTGSLAGAGGGRFLTVVVTRTADPGRWRPVTGWDSSQEERRRYGE